MLDLRKDCYNCFLLSLINCLLLSFTFFYFLLLSATIFHFKWENFLKLIKFFYTILLIAFEFIFILKRVFCLPQWLFFQMAFLQVSPEKIFSVNKLYYVISQSFFYIQLFPTFFMLQVFLGLIPRSGGEDPTLETEFVEFLV